jgi:hypothetical protein
MKNAYYFVSIRKFLAQWQEGEVSDVGEAIQQCFESIQRVGLISVTHDYYDFIQKLVGMQDYLLLSLGKCPQWERGDVKKSLYGFIFDARELLEQGALLGIENIESDYERIVDAIIEHVASTLPPRPPVISDEQIEGFMKRSINEHDHEMRAWLQQSRIDPLPDLERALEQHNLDAPGCRQVMEAIESAMHTINTQKLLKGVSAVTYLNNAPEDGSCQIWVWKQLAVSQAIGMMRQGKENMCKIM